MYFSGQDKDRSDDDVEHGDPLGKLLELILTYPYYNG